jgi:hypothetical protein
MLFADGSQPGAAKEPQTARGTLAVVRYLLVFECFLIVLLATHWLGGAADQDVARVQQAAGNRSTYEKAAGTIAATRHPAFSAEDRAMLADDLLRSACNGSPAVRPASPSAHVGREVAEDEAPPSLALGSADEIAADVPAPTRVAAAQRQLARLGYAPGPADGVLGERTARAIRNYQRRTGAAPDGRISDVLIAQLRRDIHRVAPRGPQPRRAPRQSQPTNVGAPSWIASIAVGFQRLLGHQFDSSKRPGRLREYCRANQETWIFDEGRRAFTYCGQLAAAR